MALLVLVALQLLAAPLFNMVSRRLEAAADWSALSRRANRRRPGAEAPSCDHQPERPRPAGLGHALFATHPRRCRGLRWHTPGKNAHVGREPHEEVHVDQGLVSSRKPDDL